MIRDSELRELAAFAVHEPPVLSLYLDTDLSKQLKDQAKLVLRDLLEKARSEGARGEDLTRVSRYVDLEYDWQGRGLAIFSGQAEGLWRPFPLPVPVKSQVYVGDTLYLMPLSKLVDEHEPHVVALVDQEGARLFLVNMEGIVRQENVAGEPIKHQKQGGWSATRYQRHEEQVANRNMRAAAEALARFCDGSGCSRLVLAGTEENTARFRDFLPKPMLQTIVGTIAADLNARSSEIVDRSRQAMHEAEEQRERVILDELITLKAKGAAAVTGLDDTLFAIQEGRVITLVVEDGFRAPGYLCPACDYLSAGHGQSCLFCGDTRAVPVDDVVERAAHKVLRQGARIEVIADSPVLAKVGHIGALLRY